MKTIRITELCHNIISKYIDSGMTVVDATVGNGHDTLFLSNTVGDSGKVFGFDIQEDAIKATKKLLDENSCSNTTLFNCSHCKIKEKLFENEINEIDFAIFNFGFLPKGDKNITTKTETSLLAVKNSIDILKSTGVLSLMLYTGHDEGKIEAKAIEDYIISHPKLKTFKISLPAINTAPYLLVAQKTL